MHPRVLQYIEVVTMSVNKIVLAYSGGLRYVGNFKVAGRGI